MMLIEELRAATGGAHKQLDEAMMPVVMHVNSAEAYSHLLIAFYGFFKPVYDAINVYLPADFLPDYHQRRKPQYLLNDLLQLHTSSPMVFCTDIPLIHAPEAAIGALYVLEGSTLGGLVIKKSIASRLPQVTENAFSFFAGYGNEARERWKVFVNALNALTLTAAQQQLLVVTAVQTFNKFGTWLQLQLKPVL